MILKLRMLVNDEEFRVEVLSFPVAPPMACTACALLWT